MGRHTHIQRDKGRHIQQYKTRRMKRHWRHTKRNGKIYNKIWETFNNTCSDTQEDIDRYSTRHGETHNNTWGDIINTWRDTQQIIGRHRSRHGEIPNKTLEDTRQDTDSLTTGLYKLFCRGCRVTLISLRSDYMKYLPSQVIRIRLKIEKNGRLFLDIFSSAIINDMTMTVTSRLKMDAKDANQQ